MATKSELRVSTRANYLEVYDRYTGMSLAGKNW